MLKFNILLYISLFLSVGNYGQQNNNGILSGRVLNAKNYQPVPFANVVIWGTNIGTITDIDGNFIFTALKPGYVELRASSVGFKTYISEPLLVTNAEKSYIEILLEETQVILEEVTVKASPFRKKDESPLSLRRIGIDEIEKNPGSNRDISRVIQAFPGVASTPNYRNDLIVRGGGSAENKFYLDGVEIPNLNHFATQGTSGGSVGIINVDFIREVNFYSGAFPANRGNSLSSVMDFAQIDGNMEHLKFRGSVGASDLALTIDGPAGEKTSFIASVRRSYLQFLFASLGLPFLPTYNDFQFKTRTKLTEKNELLLVGLGSIDHSRLNLDANETEEQRYILDYLPVYEQWNYTFGAVFKHFRDKSYDTWVISRNHLNNISYKYKDNIEEDSLKIFDYDSYETENKFRYEYNLRSPMGLKINAGVNFEYAKYFNKTSRILFTGEEYKYQSSLYLIKWGIFAQLSENFFKDRLTLSFGIRADANNYSTEMNNILDQLSPRFSVSYALSSKWAINSNIGRYYQLPPYTSLGFRNSNGELVNKIHKIKYISADHFVTGFDFYPNNKSKLSLEGFYKWYGNYPFSVADSVSISSKGTDFGSYGDEELLSKSKGRAYGLELLYQTKDLEGFNLILSYTFVKSEATNAQNIFIPTAWDNRHILNLTGLRNLGKNWDIGFKWRFVGGAPYTPWDYDKSSLASAWDAQGRAYPDFSRFNEYRLNSFHQLDIRVDKAYYYKKWSLRFYLDIQNIYNNKSDEPDRLLRTEDNDGNRLPASGNPPRYPLKIVKTEGSGTILPTIGIIIDL